MSTSTKTTAHDLAVKATGIAEKVVDRVADRRLGHARAPARPTATGRRCGASAAGPYGPTPAGASRARRRPRRPVVAARTAATQPSAKAAQASRRALEKEASETGCRREPAP